MLLGGSAAAILAAMTSPASSATESLVLGGGCFWCTEAAYELLPGVKAVVSGYAGGDTADPRYEEVTSGSTGHAEVIRVDFDPAQISVRDLLDYFWEVHDPTTLNRQGADVGTQYRSIILYADQAQKAAAEESRAKASLEWGGGIVTEIRRLGSFYEAERYHQDYYRRNPNAGYCRVVIKPKIDKLKKSEAVRGTGAGGGRIEGRG